MFNNLISIPSNSNNTVIRGDIQTVIKKYGEASHLWWKLLLNIANTNRYIYN